MRLSPHLFRPARHPSSAVNSRSAPKVAGHTAHTVQGTSLDPYVYTNVKKPVVITLKTRSYIYGTIPPTREGSQAQRAFRPLVRLVLVVRDSCTLAVLAAPLLADLGGVERGGEGRGEAGQGVGVVGVGEVGVNGVVDWGGRVGDLPLTRALPGGTSGAERVAPPGRRARSGHVPHWHVQCAVCGAVCGAVRWAMEV